MRSFVTLVFALCAIVSGTSCTDITPTAPSPHADELAEASAVNGVADVAKFQVSELQGATGDADDTTDLTSDRTLPDGQAVVNLDEFLSTLDQQDGELYELAAPYLEELEPSVDLTELREDAPVAEQQKYFWGLGTPRCWEHYWNPAYWASRAIAHVGYDYKNTPVGFRSKDQCKAVLAFGSTTQCVVAVGALAGWSGATWLLGKYTYLACFIATASAVSCACSQEW